MPPALKHGEDPAPGWLIDQYRRYRGLEPGEVELEPYGRRRILALSSENEILRTARRDRLEALEAMTAEYGKVRAENEILRTACRDRLEALEAMTAEYEKVRADKEVLRTGCEERLRAIEMLTAELQGLRK